MTCVKSTICDTKKAWNRPVVYSTSRGSSIAYLSRTDNVRAHADMKITPWRDYIELLIAPNKVQSKLTRSPRDWYNHTRDIYRWPYSRLRYWEVARFQFVLNTASDKRLLYVLTLFPPIARLYPRKLFGLLSFQLGVGCLVVGIEKYSNRHTD